jgi:hypothetical protein
MRGLHTIMRKSCKRKHWNTDPSFSAVAHAINGACVIDDKILQGVRIRELSAIQSMQDHTATEQDLYDILALHSMAVVMAENGIGKLEVTPVCAKARTAIANLIRRFEKWGKFDARESEIAILRELWDWHDAQRKNIPRSSYEKYLQIAINKKKNKKPESELIDA